MKVWSFSKHRTFILVTVYTQKIVFWFFSNSIFEFNSNPISIWIHRPRLLRMWSFRIYNYLVDWFSRKKLIKIYISPASRGFSVQVKSFKHKLYILNEIPKTMQNIKKNYVTIIFIMNFNMSNVQTHIT